MIGIENKRFLLVEVKEEDIIVKGENKFRCKKLKVIKSSI